MEGPELNGYRLGRGEEVGPSQADNKLRKVSTMSDSTSIFISMSKFKPTSRSISIAKYMSKPTNISMSESMPTFMPKIMSTLISKTIFLSMSKI